MKISPVEMDGVREYNEGMPVELDYDEDSDRLCVISRNEGGHDCTVVDLEDLILWLKKNNPGWLETFANRR